MLLSPSLLSPPPTIPSHTWPLKALSFIMLRSSRRKIPPPLPGAMLQPVLRDCDPTGKTRMEAKAGTILTLSQTKCQSVPTSYLSRNPEHIHEQKIHCSFHLCIPPHSFQQCLTCRLPESASLVVLTRLIFGIQMHLILSGTYFLSHSMPQNPAAFHTQCAHFYNIFTSFYFYFFPPNKLWIRWKKSSHSRNPTRSLLTTLKKDLLLYCLFYYLFSTFNSHSNQRTFPNLQESLREISSFSLGCFLEKWHHTCHLP